MKGDHALTGLCEKKVNQGFVVCHHVEEKNEKERAIEKKLGRRARTSKLARGPNSTS